MKNQKNVVVTQSCHSRKFLSGIFNACRCQRKENALSNRYVEYPRQQHSRMTPDLIGFTLIELLVVVLIIGILAAVAVPQYQKAVQKARLTQLDVTIKALTKAIDSYVLENGYQEISFTGNKESDIISYATLDITPLLCDSSTETGCINKHGTWIVECSADLYCRIEILGYDANNYTSASTPFGNEIYFYKYPDQYNQQWTFSDVLDTEEENLKILCQWAKGKFIFENDAARECSKVGI